jgi:transposase InsO family protein
VVRIQLLAAVRGDRQQSDDCLVRVARLAAGTTPSRQRGAPYNNGKKCTWCLNLGHTVDECRNKAAGRPQRLPGNNAAAAAAHIAGSMSGYAFTATATHVLADKHGWIIDSAASDHYCSQPAMFTTFASQSSSLTVGDGRSVAITGIGSVAITTRVPGQDDETITLTGVSLVPGMTVNLLSVHRLARAGLDVTFNRDQCIIRLGEKVIGVGDQLDASNLWKLRTAAGDSTALLAAGEQASLPVLQLWHERMGHLHHTAVLRLLRQRMTADGPAAPALSASDTPIHCQACVMGKHHRAAVGSTKAQRADRLLYRIHADVCGPFSKQSHTGARYLLLLVDDYSRYKWHRPMATKDESFPLIQQFVTASEAKHGQRVSILHSDNGGEFVSHAFDSWLKEHGITRELTVAYTPHQNGVAERALRTVVEMARALLVAARLPKSFWALAVATAVYVSNRCPTVSLSSRTPFEVWSGYKPSIAHLRIFGCLAYAHIHKSRRDKLDPKAVPCTFVGYSSDSTGYLLWDGHKVLNSRDVYFVEHQLGFSAGEAGEAESALVSDDDTAASPSSVAVAPPPADQQVQHVAAEPADVPPAADQPQSQLSDTQLQRVQHSQQRQKLKAGVPRELKALVDHLQPGPRDSAASTVAPIPPAPSAVAHFAFVVHAGLTATVNDGAVDPLTFREAMASTQQSQWRAAMDREMASLAKAGTYTLTPLPAGRTAIGCKWVYKTKRGADGAITKRKARLVAKGFSQRYGVDYDETYAPVARYPSIRALLALAAHHDYELHQMDVVSAYLNGDLDEEIYMAQPEGYGSAGTDQLVCKLKKSLYGLKQAARTWHHKMDVALQAQGFTALAADQCVYMRVHDGRIVIIALYVDDLLLASNHLATLTTAKASLAQQFEMDDLGEASFILGIDIRRDRAARTLSIGQSAYVTAILQRHGMEDCNPAKVPIARDMVALLAKSADDLVVSDTDTREYQSMIGGIMFAMLCTRPDIAFAVTRLAQFASKPSPEHRKALKHLLRYLRGTIDQRITYVGTSNVADQPTLEGYCDSDWGQHPDDRRSVTGYVFKLAGGAISWQSKKQKTVALSTVEAEYMATTHACKEAIWWRSYLTALGHDMSGPTVLRSDSQGSIALAKNPDHHARTKHIDVQYHFIRQHVASRTIDLQYIGTADMAADILTKALERVAHEKGRQLLGMLA